MTKPSTEMGSMTKKMRIETYHRLSLKSLNRGGGEMISHKFKNALMALPLAALLGLLGCGGVFATQPEDLLASNATADDHMAAATLYQSKAKELSAEADQYEAAASKIKPLEDPKGFRRSGLKTAMQEKRNAAAEMQELYATHVEQAQTLYGMKKAE
jgi:hypothetical protein